MLNKLIDECKNRHGDDDAWDKLSAQEKDLLAAALVSPEIRADMESIQLSRSDPDGIYTHALELYKASEGDPDSDLFYEAIKACNDALELDENHNETRLLLGKLYFEQGRYSRAEEQFKKITEGEGRGKREAYLFLAKIYSYEVNRDNNALAEVYSAIAAIDMELEEYSRALEYLKNAMKIKPNRAEDVILKAKIMLKTGDRAYLDTMITMLRELTDKKARISLLGWEAQQKEAYGLLAEVLKLRGLEGDDVEAAKADKKAAKMGYESKPMALTRAQKALNSFRMKLPKLRNGSLAKAKEHYQKAKELSEKPDMDVINELLAVLARLRDNDAVIAEAEEALKTDGLSEADAELLRKYTAEAYLEKAKESFKNKKFDEAIELMQKAKGSVDEKYPVHTAISDSSNALMDKIVSRFRGLYEGSGFWGRLTFAGRRLRREKNRARFYSAAKEYAKMLEEKGTEEDLTLAVELLEEFLYDDDVKDGNAAKLSVLHTKLADMVSAPDDKAGHIKAGVELASENFTALVMRALYYADNGAIEEAIDDLRDAVALPHDDVDLDLTRDAYTKLIELMSMNDQARDEVAIRGYQDALKDVEKKISERDDTEGKKEEEIGASSETISEKFMEIALKETVTDAEKKEASLLLTELSIDNGLTVLSEKIRALINADTINDAESALNFLSVLSSKDQKVKEALDQLRIEMKEKSDDLKLEKDIESLKRLEKEGNEALIALASDLGVENIDSLLIEGDTRRGGNSGNGKEHLCGQQFQLFEIFGTKTKDQRSGFGYRGICCF